MVIELSWITAIIRGLPPTGQYGNKAILPASATGTAIAAHGTQDRGEPKANFFLQIFASPYDHCAEGTTIINSLITC